VTWHIRPRIGLDHDRSIAQFDPDTPPSQVVTDWKRLGADLVDYVRRGESKLSL
jgi:hypothetical protein